MRRRTHLVTAVVTATLMFGSGLARAEQCVDAVRALVSWTKNIPLTNGAADSMGTNAKKNGFSVNNNPSSCSSKKPCVLVYPRTYGHLINSTYGHVAVLQSDKNSKGTVTITDSNGICGGTRKQCSTTPQWNNVSVIHPK